MSWKIDTKGDNLNDGARKLKLGTFAYKITGAKSVPDKKDPKGKRQQALFSFQLAEDPSYNCNEYLSLMAEDDMVREIAMKTLRSLAAAVGFTGFITPERLPSFVGKYVVIEATEHEGKGENKGKTFVNIRTIEPYEADGAEPAGEPEEETGTDEPTGDGAEQSLGDRADAGDDEAITELVGKAEALGIDHDALPSWVDVEAAIAAAEEAAKAKPAAKPGKVVVKKPSATAAPAPAAGKKAPWLK